MPRSSSYHDLRPLPVSSCPALNETRFTITKGERFGCSELKSIDNDAVDIYTQMRRGGYCHNCQIAVPHCQSAKQSVQTIFESEYVKHATHCKYV
jgi:hypothetical protein